MIKNILNTFFVRIVTSLLNLAITIIISRYLGAEIKGEQGIILTTISMLHIVMSIVGLGSIIFLIPRFRLLQLLIPSYVWAIIIALSFYIIFPFFQPDITSFKIDICLLSLLFTFYNLNISSLIAREKIVLANNISLVQIVLQIASIPLLLLIFKIKNINTYIISLYISYCTALIISYIYVAIHNKIKQSELTFISISNGFTQLFRYGFFNQIDLLCQLLSFRISFFILVHYSGNKSVGIYSVAVSIAESIWLISRSISTVQHAKIVNTNNTKTNIELTIRSMQISFLLSSIAVIIVTLLPSWFYVLVFGNDFIFVKQIIISLSPGIAFFSLSFIISGYFSGVGKQHLNSIASVVGLIITILCAYLLIPRFGLLGAGYTASISYILTSCFKLVLFKFNSNIQLITLFKLKFNG